MCVYDAYTNNMMCIVWGVGSLLHFSNLKSSREW